MRNKRVIIFVILLILFVLSILISLLYGLDITNKQVILTYIRVPAIIKSIIAGTCLAISGMFLQTISKNPLADPYLTGLSSGAGFGIVLSILLFNSISYSLFGFIGALISAFVVIMLSGFSKFSITKLILIGLSVNLFVGSIISFLIILNPEKAYSMTLILTGGFSSTQVSMKILVGIFLFILLLSGFFIPKLNAMRLDSKLIFKSQKIANVYNILFIILAALLTSLSVYCAGILGFVGIICPLMTKLILGSDSRVLFFGNILTGSVLLLFSNFLSNYLIYPMQIPLGIIVSIIGVPFFIFLLLRRGGILND